MKHKKCIRKLLSFLTILCCLAGNITPVYASGTGDGTSVPRVTFTNEPVNSPDLYVTKTVENALEGEQYEAPAHAVFRFVLKQNGQIAKNVTYRVLDPAYGEIVRKTSMGMSYPFRTDQTGVFTLEAGQQAWFEGMGTGSRYEVIEQDTYLLPKTDDTGSELTVSGGYKLFYGEDSSILLHEQFDYETRSLSADGWQKKSPSGGSTGEQSILPNGSYEQFTNRYIGKGTGDTTTLEITKNVSFPENYKAPDTTPEFPFVIELDGAPYANEPFTAVCEKTEETQSGTTDGKGRFMLRGGWTARFENVPADVDYKVYEDPEAVYEDAGTEIPPGSSEEADQMNRLSLERSTEESAGTVSDETGEDLDTGSVQAEDPAVLVSRTVSRGLGLGGGDGEEEPAESMWPEGWWPTQDTVQTGATQSPLTALDFHNSNVSFVVTKRLEDNSKPENIQFEFRLADENNDALSQVVYYLYNTNGEPVYKQNSMLAAIDRQPVIEADGKQIEVQKTGRQGEFYLAPGQAAVFIGLKPGTSYRVTETKNPGYTQILPLPTEDTLHTVGADGQISFVDFVNQPENLDGVLTVTKNVTYGSGEGELSGDEFHFILYKRLTQEAASKLLGDTTEESILQGLRDNKIILAMPENSSGSDTDTDMGGIIVLSDLDAASLSADEGQNISSEQSKAQSRGSLSNGMNTLIPDMWFAGIGGQMYEVYAPAKGMLFGIPEGLETPTYKTGPYKDWKRPGEFTLKAGQTARFEEKVAAGDGYLVMEADLSEEYWEVIYDGWGDIRQGHRVVYGLSEDTLQQIGVAQAGLVAKGSTGQIVRPGGLSLAFENAYMPKKIDLVLTKTDGNDETIADREAHFMLYRTQGKDSPVLPTPLPDGADADSFVYKTVDGVLTIPNLKAGTYWLHELKAPSGYALLPKPVEIDLSWSADGLTVTIDGKPYRGPEDAENVKSDVLGSITIKESEWISGGILPGGDTERPPVQMLSADGGDSRAVSDGMIIGPGMTNTEVSLSIRNTELYELPNSGGIGIYWYSIGGTMLMLAAALILYKSKRQRRC